MPSLIVTPPNKITDPGSYLLINVTPVDLEMVLRWLQINGNDLIINLYYEDMNDYAWLAETADLASHVIIEQSTDPVTLAQLTSNMKKVTWIGQGQLHNKAIDYLVQHG